MYALLYDVQVFQKSLLRYAGGIFGASQTDSKEGNFFSRYQMTLYRQGNKYVKIGESFTKQNVQSTEHFETLG